MGRTVTHNLEKTHEDACEKIIAGMEICRLDERPAQLACITVIARSPDRSARS
jgi:hypothetical protein